MGETALRTLALVAILALTACHNAPPPEPDALVVRPASFADLPGWAADDPAAALPVFLKSCAVLLKQPDDQAIGPGDVAGKVADWRPACTGAAAVPPGDSSAARAFVEAAFTPMAATNHGEANGLFTGYYEAELHGARRPDGVFSTPLYRRPPDLVSVDLQLFRPSLRGERIAGRVQNGRLVPYATRAEIDAGALVGRNLEMIWVDNPVDAFFLAIQGSGRVTLADGSVVRVGYDGENGQPYLAVGKVLVEKGIPAAEVSMQRIRQWIAEHPDEGRGLMEQNPAYVFFREVKGDGPLGAQGIALTPERSIAVDRRFVALGMPVWLDIPESASPGGRLRRLMVAQDTGGAIRGPVRADVFFGHGAEAADRAGVLKATGRYWFLVPRGVAKPPIS
ncbi:MAG TPA: MltA domain-containing protein [Stellaceae bacterium]|nr:MltA domain-containing protein [Stellaceae bacterium]